MAIHFWELVYKKKKKNSFTPFSMQPFQNTTSPLIPKLDSFM